MTVLSNASRPHRPWHLLTVAALLLAASGCTSWTPIQVAYTPDHRELSQRQTVVETEEAEACSFAFLYVIRGGDASLQEAMEDIPKSSPSRRLASVTVDNRTTSFLLVERSCTVVEATFVSGGEQDRTAAPHTPRQAPSQRTRAANDTSTRQQAQQATGSSPNDAAGEASATENQDAAGDEATSDLPQVELGSTAALYRSRSTLVSWTGSRVEVKRADKSSTVGTLVELDGRTLVVETDAGNQLRVSAVGASWIRKLDAAD